MCNNEAEWLRAAQEGSEESFTSLIEKYQTPVYNMCYRMLGNAGDAEDAAQETFWRAYQAIKRYFLKGKDSPLQPGTWMALRTLFHFSMFKDAFYWKKSSLLRRDFGVLTNFLQTLVN